MSKRCTNPKMMAHPEQCKGICEQCDDYKEWPATCPDCEHPAHEGYVCFPINLNGCHCDHTPAEPDSRKKHCTDSRSLEDIEQCCGEQPTPAMPLGWQISGFVEKAISKEMPLWECVDCIVDTLEAHDSEVVKEFAEKLELRLQEEMHHPELSEWDSGYQKALQDSLAHIRAIVEKETQQCSNQKDS